jgi:hypothetical protein
MFHYKDIVNDLVNLKKSPLTWVGIAGDDTASPAVSNRFQRRDFQAKEYVTKDEFLWSPAGGLFFAVGVQEARDFPPEDNFDSPLARLFGCSVNVNCALHFQPIPKNEFDKKKLRVAVIDLPVCRVGGGASNYSAQK